MVISESHSAGYITNYLSLPDSLESQWIFKVIKMLVCKAFPENVSLK